MPRYSGRCAIKTNFCTVYAEIRLPTLRLQDRTRLYPIALSSDPKKGILAD